MARARLARTFWIGVAIIVACEALLVVDMQRRGGIVEPSPAELPEPSDALGWAARYVGVNITPLCWAAYLLVFDGLATWLARRRDEPSISSIRARPNRFIVAWLTSIPVWCFFDTLNFYFLDAWRYHNLPGEFGQRIVGYFIAFAAISPGMFLAAQVFQHAGMRRVVARDERARRRVCWFAVAGVPTIVAVVTFGLVIESGADVPMPRPMLVTALLLFGPLAALAARRADVLSLAVGVGFLAWALLVRDPIGCMTLWLGLIYLFDPLNAKLGAPSLLHDWQAGRWGRTLSLFAAGALCGLLWEFWNYWAIAKWTYDLPFLGRLEQYRLFEMPFLGFLGFLPFACECWVVLNTIVALLERAGLRVAEPLPDEHAVL